MPLLPLYATSDKRFESHRKRETGCCPCLFGGMAVTFLLVSIKVIFSEKISVHQFFHQSSPVIVDCLVVLQIIVHVLHIFLRESDSVMHCFKCNVHTSACTLCHFPGVNDKQLSNKFTDTHLPLEALDNI